MGGQDKGLVLWRGQALGLAVLTRMAPQVPQVIVSANRNAEAYAELWRQSQGERLWSPDHVFPDDADLPPRSGPLAGMLTALRRADTEWVQFVPCDSPNLPTDLVERLLAAAKPGVDIVVPQTPDEPDAPRLHWVCALVRRATLPALASQFADGERKVSRWIGASAWRSVSFDVGDGFANINALETSHAPR
ncbi:MAG: molybdenum cofactor guanylyltransferase [Pseudomonadota bacterium]